MLKTLGKQIKEFKAASIATPSAKVSLHDSHSHIIVAFAVIQPTS